MSEKWTNGFPSLEAFFENQTILKSFVLELNSVLSARFGKALKIMLAT